jgi:hypothetical protein
MKKFLIRELTSPLRLLPSFESTEETTDRCKSKT